jgi:hypothetical protein
MSKVHAKFLFFLLGIAVAVPLVVLLISLIGQFLAYFQQGANPASIFRGHELVIPKREEARWLPFEGYDGAEPSQVEQDEILAGYRDAWLALTRAHETGDTTDLLTYWAGDAYRQVLSAVNPKQPMQQKDTGHRLRLTFFSDDGSIVAFEDDNFTLQQTIGKDTLKLTASASVIMTLDNGFWRIRTLVLTLG